MHVTIHSENNTRHVRTTQILQRNRRYKCYAMTQYLALILVDAHIAAVAPVALRVAAGRGRRQRRGGAINVAPRLRGVGL